MEDGEYQPTYTCDICGYVGVGDSIGEQQLDLIAHIKKEHPEKRIFKLGRG